MGKICYVTGPARGGKSRFAVERALAWGPDAVFVATYRPQQHDPEMEARVRSHRAERPASWRTLEAPRDVAAALASLRPEPAGAILDCLTLWASDRLGSPDSEILGTWRRQLEAFRLFPWPVLIVGNEVGWGPVPEDPCLRRFRDLAGWLGQATAAASDEAWLLVAGCPVALKAERANA